MPIANDYFKNFEDCYPAPLNEQGNIWRVYVIATILVGANYIYWRWASTINVEEFGFSVFLITCETLSFFSLIIFFYDIWGSARQSHSNSKKKYHRPFEIIFPDANVDVFIATKDEPVVMLKETINDAKRLIVPPDVNVNIFLLDDGDREEVLNLALCCDVQYFSRSTGVGYKGGNLNTAIDKSDGQFIVICDADTRLFPTFIQNTLPYFRDECVAWVQTPHWFYDIPDAKRAKKESNIFGRLLDRFVYCHDPFIADQSIFFDVIQRRRNRDLCSFCCGAASIHRRTALRQLADHERKLTKSADTPSDAKPVEYFSHHVSEDLFTSIRLHALGWKSAYHPNREARMLSPWSFEAWSTQQYKYAAGTLDIFWKCFRKIFSTMNFRVASHYLSTFVSYLSVLWMLPMVVFPYVSVWLGANPIYASETEYFLRFMPFLVLVEFSLLKSCNGYDTFRSRILTFILLPIKCHAFLSTVVLPSVGFSVTPKLPKSKINIFLILVVVFLLVISAITILRAGVDIYSCVFDCSGSGSLIYIFWISVMTIPLFSTLRMLLWDPSHVI